jgi:integrase
MSDIASSDPMHHALLLILFTTPLRIGAVCRLRLYDINAQHLCQLAITGAALPLQERFQTRKRLQRHQHTTASVVTTPLLGVAFEKHQQRIEFAITPETCDAIVRFVHSRGGGTVNGSPYLFPSCIYNNGHISVASVRAWFKRTAMAVGIPRELAHPHVTRHTFACRCIEHGISKEMVTRLLGHRDPRTTDLYTAPAELHASFRATCTLNNSM